MKIADITTSILVILAFILVAWLDSRDISKLRLEVKRLEGHAEDDDEMIDSLIMLIGRVNTQFDPEGLTPVERAYWSAAVAGYENFIAAVEKKSKEKIDD